MAVWTVAFVQLALVTTTMVAWIAGVAFLVAVVRAVSASCTIAIRAPAFVQLALLRVKMIARIA